MYGILLAKSRTESNSPRVHTLAYLVCESVIGAVAAASAAMPGNCVNDAAVDVELGRDMGSTAGGGGSNGVSSMSARWGCDSRERKSGDRVSFAGSA
jgi:hypothetical protein